MTAVLKGIRVLDFGRYVAGPYCATLLGYLGAEVIRIERLSGGEDRYIAPVTESGEGAVLLQTGCNKKSLALDVKSEEGKQIIGKLIASSDIVVANLPDAALKKMGLDLSSLRAIKPDIILASMSTFGSKGPLSKLGGFDGIGQAMSGASYISGTPGNPAKAAAPYVDYTTAVLAAFGVMAALMERQKSGQGQEVKATLLGTALSVFNSHLIEEGVLSLGRTGTGNRVQTSSPSDVFKTRDGHILVHSPGDAVYARWAKLMGEDKWLKDPRFANDQVRGDHRDIICARMQVWCDDYTMDQALSVLAEAGIPAGPILTPAEALAHPQVSALGLLKAVDYPGLPRPAPVADLPISLSESGGGIESRPPLIGEHTDEILTDIGYAASECDSLRAKGII